MSLPCAGEIGKDPFPVSLPSASSKCHHLLFGKYNWVQNFIHLLEACCTNSCTGGPEAWPNLREGAAHGQLVDWLQPLV